MAVTAFGDRAPVSQLARLFEEWSNMQRAHGGSGADPLATAALANTSATRPGVQALGAGEQPISPLVAAAQGAAQVNHNAGSDREGAAFQSYSTPDGYVNHVYYTPDGKRQVIRFKAPVAPAAVA